MNRPRVLVVEDRPSVLKLMATILEGGYEVATASDGPAALELIGARALDVVVSDVRMPGASGFEVLRAVRSRPNAASVVLMTAYANVPDAVAAMRLGAYDYIAKPLDADEIALVVARAVEHRRHPDARDEGDAERDPRDEGAVDVSAGFRRAVEEARDRASRRYLTDLMRLFHGNVTQAASRAGMTRESLHRVLKRYSVRAEHPRAEAGEGGPERVEPDRPTVARPESGGLSRAG
jgi:DNA-binding NtrC family response regulator